MADGSDDRVAKRRRRAQTLADRYDHFVFDCDGVIYHGREAIEGSIETINRLVADEKDVRFVTNNSCASRKQYAAKLSKFGILSVKETDITTSATATAMLVKNDDEFVSSKHKIYLIGESGAEKEFEAQGIEVISDTSKVLTEASFRDIRLDPAVTTVVVAWDREFDFGKLCRASLYVQKGCKFLATNLDQFDVLPGTGNFPGAGAMVSSVSASLDHVDPVVGGKPSKTLMEWLIKNNDFDPKRTLVIGDRLNTDIALGNTVEGVHTMLVLSGCTSLEEAKAAKGRFKPTWIRESARWLLENE